MNQSIPPVPIPPRQPRGICSGSLFRGRAFVRPGATPRNLIHVVSKLSQACRGKRYEFREAAAWPRRTRQAC